MADEGAVREEGRAGAEGAEGAEGGEGGGDCSVSGEAGEAGPARVAVGASPDITIAGPDPAAPTAERGPKQVVVHEWAGKLVLVPAEMWPDFACNEHGGMGCAAAPLHPATLPLTPGGAAPTQPSNTN